MLNTFTTAMLGLLHHVASRGHSQQSHPENWNTQNKQFDEAGTACEESKVQGRLSGAGATTNGPSMAHLWPIHGPVPLHPKGWI